MHMELMSSLFFLQTRATKGPIFEDGPNFDMAFRLFHGQNGVVPLSEGSLQFPQKVKVEPVAQQFNPLAAKAATISLSGFGGSFGFDAFNEIFKNQQKKHKSSKKDSSQVWCLKFMTDGSFLKIMIKVKKRNGEKRYICRNDAIRCTEGAFGFALCNYMIIVLKS